MKFEDLKPKLNEYDNLPNDLTARLDFDPPPPLPMYCRECSKHYKDFPITWDDIDKELKLGHGDKDYKLMGLCPEHEAEDDEPEEAEGK